MFNPQDYLCIHVCLRHYIYSAILLSTTCVPSNRSKHAHYASYQQLLLCVHFFGVSLFTTAFILNHNFDKDVYFQVQSDVRIQEATLLPLGKSQDLEEAGIYMYITS